MKKQATHVCATCEKSTITAQQIALLKLTDELIQYECTVTKGKYTSSFARFNRKNCKDYKGPGSGNL